MKMVAPGLYGGPDSDRFDLEQYRFFAQLSRMPPDTRLTKRFSTFELVAGRESGWQAALDMVQGKIDPPLLLLYGQPGRSKSHLAYAIGWAFLAALKTVLYYQVVELLDALRKGVRIQSTMRPVDMYDADSLGNLMDRLVKYELLIIDDLGLENATDFASERLDYIVDSRFVHRVATVITTNTLDISPRILDRCKEGMLVRLEGESYRDIIQKRKKVAK